MADSPLQIHRRVEENGRCTLDFFIFKTADNLVTTLGLILSILCHDFLCQNLDSKQNSPSKCYVSFQHNGEAPKNYREKNQLKDLIREGNVSIVWE